MTDESEILAALRTVIDPEIGRSIVELGMVRDLTVAAPNRLSFTLALTVPTCPMKEQIAFNARQVLQPLGFQTVEIAFGAMSEAPLLARLPIDPQVTALCDSGRAGEARLPELDAVVERLLQVEAVARPPAR